MELSESGCGKLYPTYQPTVLELVEANKTLFIKKFNRSIEAALAL